LRIDLKTEGLRFVTMMNYVKLSQCCVCFTHPCFQSLVLPSITHEYYTKVLELDNLLWCLVHRCLILVESALNIYPIPVDCEEEL